jgi:hypothetical protein
MTAQGGWVMSEGERECGVCLGGMAARVNGGG